MAEVFRRRMEEAVCREGLVGLPHVTFEVPAGAASRAAGQHGSTVDTGKAFFASRYGKGEADYLNCPMTEEEYTAFYRELTQARRAELHSFDGGGDYSSSVFEGCMPVEVMAMRGPDTLRFGPLKPVGLEDPRYPGRQFYAVVQLRKENTAERSLRRARPVCRHKADRRARTRDRGLRPRKLPHRFRDA